MVDAVRIIDLWQVILQEPRVAELEAALLMQGEIEQHKLREKLDQQHQLDKQQVLRTKATKGHIVDSLDKDSCGKKFAARYMKRKKKKRNKTGSVKNKKMGHVDTFA